MKLESKVHSQYKILEEVEKNGIATVYKACDTINMRNGTLKILEKDILSPYIEDKIRFHKEIETVGQLDHPGIVKFYDSGEYDGTLYVSMEMLEGITLQDLIRQGQVFPIYESIKVVKQIAGALSFAHGQRLVHRALRADNVFVTGKENSVKLLDFGMSLVMIPKRIKQEADVISVFGYMPPEATGIVNKPVDERSDLYSLGVIFYQLLTMELPFKGRTAGELSHQQVLVTASAPSRINSDIPKVLDSIVKKLLDKDPEGRYQSAVGLYHDLERFEKGDRDFALGEMDQRVKLSRNVRFVGRDKEFETIKEMVNQTRHKKGAICLISGEAGSGKSRLVEEIRSYVFEQDGIFFTGKCFDQENKVPYKPFKDITEKYIKRFNDLDKDVAEKEIRWLKSTLSGEIKEIVKLNPEFEEVVGNLPELAALDDPEKQNVRFRLACSKFFTNLTAEATEVVLFIDDLQWADDGTLTLLEEMAKVIGHSNVLILGTYRSNEVEADHGLNKIKARAVRHGYPLHDISLKPFDYERMHKLVAETLGEPLEKAERLAHFLLKNTHGNPFFTITFLKELVDRKLLTWDRGSWKENWGEIEKLPAVATLIDMVLFRTNQLPERVDRMLKVSSIVGKEFHMAMLYKLINENQETIIFLVDEAVERELLERAPEKNKFIFAHDRIKEAFETKMSDEEKIGFHLRIAQIIEEQNEGREEEVAFELAHHYMKSHSREKALHYCLMAAEKARVNYANKEAIKLFHYAKEMILRKEGKSKKYLEILENSGEVCRREGMHLEALKNYDEAIALTEEKIRKASISQKIGETYFYMGRLEKAIAILEQTLGLLDFRTTPKSKPAIIVHLIVEMIKQNLHFAFPGLFKNSSQSTNERYLIAVRTCLRLSYCYLYVDLMKAILVELRSVNMVDKMKGTREYAFVYILQVPMYACAPMFPLGDRYMKEGTRAALEVKDKLMEGFACIYHSMLYFAENNPDKAIEVGRKGTEIVLPLGERWDITIGYAFPCFAHYAKGEPELMKISAENLRLAAEPADDMRSRARPIYFIGRAQMMTSEVTPELIRRLEKGVELEKQVGEDSFIAMGLAGVTLAYTRMGDLDTAMKRGEEGVGVFSKAAAPGFWANDIFGITADVYLRKIAQSALDEKTKEDYLCRAEFLSKRARSWADKYKAYLGFALRTQAKCLWFRGRRDEAVKTFEQSIRVLEANKYRYELAWTLFEFGKCMYSDGSSRDKGAALLKKAKGYFQDIGAVADLKEVNRVLKVENNGTERHEGK